MSAAQAAVEDEEEDLDAVLDRELAQLTLSEASEVDKQVLLDLEPSHGLPTDTDGEDDSLQADASGLADLQSFTALQAMLHKRDQQCEQFMQELHSSSLLLPTAATSHAPAAPSVDVSCNASDLFKIDDEHAIGTVGKQNNAPQEPSINTPGREGESSTVQVQLQLQSAVQKLNTQDASNAETSQVGTLRSTTDDGNGECPHEDATSQGTKQEDGYAARTEQVVQGRRAVQAERAAAEQQHIQRRQQQREQQQQQAQEQQALAQAASDAAAQQLAKEHAAMVAALDAAQAEAQQELKQLQAQQANERQCLQQERERLRQQLAEQEAGAAARDLAAQELHNQAQMQLAHELWRQVAAKRILRAWRCYYISAARQQRLTAVVGLQAAVRAWLARRLHKQLHQQHVVVEQLEAAAGSGNAEQVQAALQQASALGLNTAELQARISRLQSESQQAQTALQQAARQGDAVMYRQAMQAARRFPHLAADLVAAEKVHQSRVTAAVSALQATVKDRPMQDIVKAADAAVQLGAEASTVSAMLDAARQRDAALQAALMSLAGQVPYSAESFAVAAARANTLGLKGDVAAAQTVLNQRRRQLAARLPAAAAELSYDESQGLLCEAQQLGLVQEAARLGQQLAQRQQAAVEKLQRVAAQSTPDHLQELLLQAEQHGVPASVQSEAQATMTARQQQAARGILQAAQTGTLRAYKSARRVALQCGAVDCIPAAEAALQARQQQTCTQLAATGQQLQLQLQDLPHTIMTGFATCLHETLGLGPMEHVASSACEGDLQQGCYPAIIPQPSPVAIRQSTGNVTQAGSQGTAAGTLSSSSMQHSSGTTSTPPSEFSGARHAHMQPLPTAAVSILSGQAAGQAALPLAHALWQQLQAAVSLGLQPHASLVLGGLMLMQRMRHAQGLHVAAQLVTGFDHDGTPSACAGSLVSVPTRHSQMDTATCTALAVVTTGTSSPAAPQPVEVGDARCYVIDAEGQPAWADNTQVSHSKGPTADLARQTAPSGSVQALGSLEDAVVQAVAVQSQGGGCVPGGGLWLWPPARTRPTALQLQQLPTATCQATFHSSATQHNDIHGGDAPVVVHKHGVHGKASQHPAKALSKSMLLSIVGQSVSLDRVTELDLGLEMLDSVSGLDTWCPALRTLRLDGNQLSQLQGLEQLTCLVELSVKQNQLAGLPGGLLSNSLHVLHLDGNQLVQLDGLQQLSRLHILTAADNLLHRVKLADPHSPSATSSIANLSLSTCCPHLSTLELPGNHLTSLQDLCGCTSLTHLDVSRNQLTSLDGLQTCVLLQHVNAARNCLSTWPGAAVAQLHHLKHLNLSHNHISSWSLPSHMHGAHTHQQHQQHTAHTQHAATAATTPVAAAVAATGLHGSSDSSSMQGGLRQEHQSEHSMHSWQGSSRFRQEVILPASLQVLLLQDNQLPHLCDAVLGPRLVHLDVSFNCITQCDQLAALAPLMHLTSLKAHDNPVALLSDYLPTLHTFLPQLQELDLQPLNPQQQLQHIAQAALQSPALAAAHARSIHMQGDGSTLSAVQAAAAAAAYCRRQMTLDGSEVSDALQRSSVDQAAAQQHVHALRRWMHNCMERAATRAEVIHSSSDADSWQLSQLDALYSLVDEHATEQSVARAFRLKAKVTARATIAALEGAPVQSPAVQALQIPVRMSSQAALAQVQNLQQSMWSSSSVATVRHIGAGSYHQPAVRSQMGDETVVWASYDHEYQQAVAAVRSQQAQEVAQVLAHRQASSTNLPGEPACEAAGVLYAAVGGEFYTRRLQVLIAAVVRIQAVVRGWRARKLAQELRSQQYQQALLQAVVLLQSAWRAHAVLRSPQLAARRRQIAAQRKVAEVQRQQQHAQAAVAIQSAARGWLVRRRMHAALQAARLHADDDDDLDQFDAASDFLADIESILEKEQLQPSASPPSLTPSMTASAGRTGQEQAIIGSTVKPRGDADVSQQGPSSTGPHIPAVPAAKLLATAPTLAKAFAAKMASAQLQNPADNNAAAVSNSHVGVKSAWASPAVDVPKSTPALALQQDYTQHNPAVLLPPLHYTPGTSTRPAPVMIGDESAGGLGANPSEILDSPTDCQSQAASCTTEAYAADAAAAAARRARHVERLEALMAEWGFQDMATAEAYWRRQQRATHGATRRKLQERYKDPALRLRKLQEKVDQRVMMRPEDMHRSPLHGPEVQLSKGALQGPLSKTSQGEQHTSRQDTDKQSGVGLSPMHARTTLSGSNAVVGAGAGYVASSTGAGKVPQGRYVSSADAALSRPADVVDGCDGAQRGVDVAAWQRSNSCAQQQTSDLLVGAVGHAWPAQQHGKVVGLRGSPPAVKQGSSNSNARRQSAGAEQDDGGDARSVCSFASAVSEPVRNKGSVGASMADRGKLSMPPLRTASSLASADAGLAKLPGRTFKK